MKRIAEALKISRPHLASTKTSTPKERTSQERAGDDELLDRILPIVQARATYGYRRVTAVLRREPNGPRINHKRVYRLMKKADLLLPKHSGRPERPHDGKVITLASNLRWCSDAFEIRCWNGDRVHVAFSLDCHDREAIAWVAANRHLDGVDIRDLVASSVEARFSSTTTPRPIEWLSDNGPPYVAHETRDFIKACGMVPRNTPSYSPESNGMAEAFVKTFKRDYVYLAELPDATTVLEQLPRWFADYNENHPHKGLKMLSPRQFRRLQTT